MFKVNRKHQSVPLKQVAPLRHVITCLLHLQKGKIIASSIITSSSGYFLQHNVFGKLFSLNLLLAIIFAIKCDSNSLLQYNNQTCVEVHKKFFEEQKLHFCLGHHFLLASGTQPGKFINQVISTQNIQTSKMQHNKL